MAPVLAGPAWRNLGRHISAQMNHGAAPTYMKRQAVALGVAWWHWERIEPWFGRRSFAARALRSCAASIGRD
jgi:hypothetical protein